MDFTRVGFPDDSCGWPQNSDSLAEEITREHNASSPVTPKSDTVPVAFNFDNGSSSDVSPDHDSDSYYSELDSETEAFYSSLNHHLVSPGATDGHDVAAEKQVSYEELMNKYVQCQEELRATSLKLQESEQEIEILKKGGSAVLFAENLRSELETALREIETRDIDIETERRRVLEMQRQVLDLETKLADSTFKFENVMDELEVSRECLDVSNAEISKLREMVHYCQQSFSTEKTKLQTDISGLLENQTFFEARVKESESRVEVLEDQISHSDAEMLEVQRKELELQAQISALKDQISHSDAEKLEMQRKELELQAEISALKTDIIALKTDLSFRDDHIEALDQALENTMLKYSTLMAEKNGIFAQVHNLKAEMRSREIQIKQMEVQLNQLRFVQTKLLSESGTSKNTVKELRATVKELEKQAELQRNANNTVEELRATVKVLEKQAELQRNAISQGEEEKREAIRQLCFSLDHYKSGYRQLLRFLSSNNKQQQAIMVV